MTGGCVVHYFQHGDHNHSGSLNVFTDQSVKGDITVSVCFQLFIWLTSRLAGVNQVRPAEHHKSSFSPRKKKRDRSDQRVNETVWSFSGDSFIALNQSRIKVSSKGEEVSGESSDTCSTASYFHSDSPSRDFSHESTSLSQTVWVQTSLWQRALFPTHQLLPSYIHDEELRCSTLILNEYVLYSKEATPSDLHYAACSGYFARCLCCMEMRTVCFLGCSENLCFETWTAPERSGIKEMKWVRGEVETAVGVCERGEMQPLKMKPVQCLNPNKCIQWPKTPTSMFLKVLWGFDKWSRNILTFIFLIIILKKEIISAKIKLSSNPFT